MCDMREVVLINEHQKSTNSTYRDNWERIFGTRSKSPVFEEGATFAGVPILIDRGLRPGEWHVMYLHRDDVSVYNGPSVATGQTDKKAVTSESSAPASVEEQDTCQHT